MLDNSQAQGKPGGELGKLGLSLLQFAVMGECWPAWESGFSRAFSPPIGGS